jgi:hypothetical protein
MERSAKKEMRKEGKKIGKQVAKEAGYMSASHYFSTLADPFNVHGEKIPDEISYPSSTFSIVDRHILNLNSSGFGAIAYGIAGGNTATVYGSMVPVIMQTSLPLEDKTMVKKGDSGKPSVPVFTNWYVGTETANNSSTASASNVFPADISGEVYPFQFAQWQTGVGVPTLYSKARLVSAGLSIDYLGTALGAKGSITLASVPRRTLRQLQTDSAITLQDIQNLVGAQIIAVNKLQGGSLTYHPLDNISFQYADLESTYDATSNANHDLDPALGNEFYIVVDGAEAGATCQITGVFNYEAIPKIGTLNLVQPTYSRNDPIELSMTMNAVEKVPTAHAGNRAARNIESGKTQLPAVASPEASKLAATEEIREEDEEDSFMTKVLDGAEGVLSKAPGIIGKATPLVRSALGFLGV